MFPGVAFYFAYFKQIEQAILQQMLFLFLLIKVMIDTGEGENGKRRKGNDCKGKNPGNQADL